MDRGNLKRYRDIDRASTSYVFSFPGPIEISEREFEMFRRLIYEKSGINLNRSKKNLLQARLTKRLHQLRCESFSQYYRYIENDPTGEELTLMLNAVSTNLTRFFREEEHFHLLDTMLLPELIVKKRKIGDLRLRAWSAGCSSGEEAYSIAITILNRIETPFIWDIKILGTDISTEILKKASEGIYEKEKVDGIPEEQLHTYFLRGTGPYRDYYKVKPILQRIVTFQRLNLIDDHYPFKGRFDFIFCRNVMIYFDKNTQEEIVDRFYNCLEWGGYLFIGHSESLIGKKTSFKYIMPAVYRKEDR